MEPSIPGATMSKTKPKAMEPAQPPAPRSFRLEEVNRIVQDIIARYDLGFTEVTYQRAGGGIKFVKFSVTFKIEDRKGSPINTHSLGNEENPA